MPISLARWGVVVFATLLPAAPVAFDAAPSSPRARGGGVRPISIPFEENAGQFAGDVRFFAHGDRASLVLRDEGATLSVRAGPTVLALSVAGGHPVSPRAEEALPSYSNYFLGRDPARYRTHVRHFARVVYPSVRDGIDLVYHAERGALEYDFVVAPGGRPEEAVLEVSGAAGLSLNDAGDLVVRTASGAVVQSAPRVYQRDGDREVNVPARYRVVAPTRVGFEVARYDRSRPLVIDPVLAFATYLGGATGAISSSAPGAIAVDASGDVFVTGMTTADDFPTTANALTGSINVSMNPGSVPEDAFVTKLGGSGTTLVFSTYLGGTSSDLGSGIAVDKTGNVYVTGTTSSGDFPLKNALFTSLPGKAGASAGFVTELSPDGSGLVYSTLLLGGIVGNAIAVDGAQNAYVAGTGGNDAVVVKLATGGSKLAYTFSLKGSSSTPGVATSTSAAGIAVDGMGNAYVVGRTSSPDFPVANGLSAKLSGSSDAFVAKIDPMGATTPYATFLGGGGDEQGTAIAVDGKGNAFVTGSTGSSDFPTKGAVDGALAAGDASNGSNTDAFVAELDPSGSALVYATYLGGTAEDVGTGVAIDGSGNAYVTGWTRSFDFPTKNALFPGLMQGDEAPPQSDVFVAELATGGASLVYSSYIGGSSDDVATGIAVDESSTAYVTGYSASLDFPTRRAVRDMSTTTGGDADSSFVLGLGTPAPPRAPAPSSGGCGCRVGRVDSSNTRAGVLGAVLATLMFARRRRTLPSF
ncbi:MAG TPA: SBBP repeat-containing protein [Polyangiaceae bacterium]|nr:SBBP repeat-containing protein [Polyangiaceae bacterium]